MKICTGCLEEKPLTLFSKNKATHDGYQRRCKSCLYAYETSPAGKASSKKYRQSEKGKKKNARFASSPNGKAAQKKYLSTPKGHASRSGVAARHRAKPETQAYMRAYAALPSRKAYKAKWDKNHKPILSFYAMRYVSMKLLAMPRWVNKDDFLPFYKKARELTTTTGIEHHVDHIVPLRGGNVCGLHVPYNLQVITKSENSKKSNRLLNALVG